MKTLESPASITTWLQVAFVATYHYYNLQRATANQVEILVASSLVTNWACPTSIHKRPQQPSFYTVG